MKPLVSIIDYGMGNLYSVKCALDKVGLNSLITRNISIIEKYDQSVNSPSISFKLPSVIALKDYIMPQRKPAFTRFNVFLRDNFTCQYCAKKFAANDLTFDHLVPRCLHGKTTWQNVVSACTTCNLKKGRKLIQNTDMKLLKTPVQPHSMQLQNNGRNFPPNYLHDSWRDYLYWDTELEN